MPKTSVCVSGYLSGAGRGVRMDMTSLALHEYLMRKLREYDGACFNVWGIGCGIQPFRDTRNILRAAGHDVGELDAQIRIVEIEMEKLRQIRVSAVESFERSELFVVTDVDKRVEIEKSMLQ